MCSWMGHDTNHARLGRASGELYTYEHRMQRLSTIFLSESYNSCILYTI